MIDVNFFFIIKKLRNHFWLFVFILFYLFITKQRKFSFILLKFNFNYYSKIKKVKTKNFELNIFKVYFYLNLTFNSLKCAFNQSSKLSTQTQEF